MNKKRIICVLGHCCSGKNTFAHTLINHTQIDIGTIVRCITNNSLRSHDASLDEQIIKQVDDRLKSESKTNFVITGIRQISILDHIIANNPTQVEMVWLSVPDEELKRRFINRAAKKDKGLTFEQVVEKDNQLGLKDIEKFKNENQDLFTIIKHY